MSGTFLTVAANPSAITMQSIWTPSLKSPSSFEFDFQQVWTGIMDFVAWRNIRSFNKRNLELPVLAPAPSLQQHRMNLIPRLRFLLFNLKCHFIDSLIISPQKYIHKNCFKILINVFSSHRY